MLDQATLKKYLQYDPETGVFTHIKSRRGVRMGDVVGTLRSDGYLRMALNGKHYYAHRLAWFYIHGVFLKEMDHINGIRNDNRLCNLRESTAQQNTWNRTKRSDNTSGYKGVWFKKSTNKWTSQIMDIDKRKHLGYFKTPEEAHHAYQQAAKQLHGEFFKEP
jgi:hypothetical protein